jgi:hypothetical protein
MVATFQKKSFFSVSCRVDLTGLENKPLNLKQKNFVYSYQIVKIWTVCTHYVGIVVQLNKTMLNTINFRIDDNTLLSCLSFLHHKFPEISRNWSSMKQVHRAPVVVVIVNVVVTRLDCG